MWRPPDQSGTVHIVRPLFFPQPLEQDQHLSRATAKVVQELRKEFENLGSAGRHRELIDWSFCPDMDFERCELRLDLQEQMFRGFFPLVAIRRFNRRIAFCPHVPEVWFEVLRGETLRDRAAEVYQQHFRRLKRQQETVASQLELLSRKQQAWITNIDLEVDVRQEFKEPSKSLFALLGGSQTFHGGHELQRVGRCLDWRYPDGLHRALHRDELADRLEELLSAKDNRPVLLVGPRQTGKTALLHEFVYRKVSRQGWAYQSKNCVWLVSPQRLISGMSYVGQWENRLLAILRHARLKRHTLFFDDVLGLFRAGISASSSLSVADVLKPYIERREVRVVGEMTPEQLRVLRERDRGLADLFHVVRVDEPDEDTTLHILLASIRSLELRHTCRFDLDVLPAALDLTRRYVREAAMPGKAASFLNRLALKYQNKDIHRNDVLNEFHATSGLDVALLDTRARLRRADVIGSLAKEIIGQPQALDAMADVVTIAKARLNDPNRPLGSLLFLGPTGVGKTQSAKALARYLFGDANRLVRFDMNEFITAESAARLVGVFDRPEGLLTSEVRRQPFSVLLLDEIEKAHPDVFDLLLQVLGEGRLTDGHGRTADFTNAVIILTSNLGTRQAAERVGFERGGAAEASVYVKAVEDFFRPEFFNRLDRIVPFNRLERDELARIAEMTLHDVLGREGLVRRRCAMQIAPEALDWVIQCGYHPVLGARAMKRAVEQELVQPLARQLTNISPSTPTVLRIDRPKETILVEAVGLTHAACPEESRRPEFLAKPAGMLERIHAALTRIDAQCRQHRPKMTFTAGAISVEQYHYLACEELLSAALEECRRLQETLDYQRHHTGAPSLPSAAQPRRYRRSRRSGGSDTLRIDGQLFAEQDLDEYLAEMAGRSVTKFDDSQIEHELRELIDHTALLDALAPDEDGWTAERVLVIVRSLDERAEPRRQQLARCLLRQFNFQPLTSQEPHTRNDAASFGFEASPLIGVLESQGTEEFDSAEFAEMRKTMEHDARKYHLSAVLLEGCQARRLAMIEQGTHMFTDAEGRLAPLQVIVWPLETYEEPHQGLQRCLAAHEANQSTADNEGPFHFRPIVRIYSHSGAVLDLRTGQTSPFPLDGLTEMLLASLPLPPELR